MHLLTVFMILRELHFLGKSQHKATALYSISPRGVCTIHSNVSKIDMQLAYRKTNNKQHCALIYASVHIVNV